MHVTIFRGATNTTPITAGDLPWLALVAELDGAITQTAHEKTELLAIGPYRLREGSARGDANVVERTLLALDSDDGTAPEDFVDRLRALGRAGYVYTTPGDSPGRRKCRLVIPITAPLAPADARVALTACAEALGMAPGCGVERTLDDSRIYFVGRLDGTPERERWIVDGEPLDAATLPAPRHAWVTPSARPTLTLVPPLAAPPVYGASRADAMAAELPPSIAHQGGDDALFRAVRALAAITGPDRAELRAALEIFNARCQPRWPASKLDREADREIDRLAVALVLRRAVNRAAPSTEAETETPGPALETEAPGPAAILTTPRGQDVFVYDPRLDAYREVSRQNLIVMLRTSGADHYVQTTGPKGGQLSPDTIINQNATMVDDAIADFRSPAPCLYDREAKRLLLGILCPKIKPREDPRVALWLEALAGDELDAVHEWIASTRQDRIHRLATALCLIGPHGAGKTVFAQICALLWGAPPVELGHVAAQFNAAMATCPIVLDDECKCLARRNVTTEEFRVLVQARARLYEPKGKERRPLLGAQRFILTANDVKDLRFANTVGHGAVDALAERITVVVSDDEQAEHARAMLDAVRVSSGDLDWAALTEHFTWIRETVSVPSERTRFLGQSTDRARARRAVVAHALEVDQGVYDLITAVATGASPPTDAIMIESGALWVHARRLATLLHLSTSAEKWDVPRVQRALEPIRGKRDLVWHAGTAVRAREIDVDRLVEFCTLDAEAVARTLRETKGAE